MPVYRYRAHGPSGERATGTLLADSPRQARDQLRDRRLDVVRIDAVAAGRGAAAPRLRRPLLRRRSLRDADRLALTRDLATLLAVGAPLLEALDTLARQHGPRVRPVLHLLRDRVAAGRSLADSMREQPAAFDAVCVSMIEVGELAGNLDDALRRYASFRERAGRLRNRVAGALTYPAAVALVGAAVTLFLMTRVVPRLLEALADTGRPLPAATRIVKAVSDAAVGYWWAIALGTAAAAAGFATLRRHAGVRARMDRAVLRLPVIGRAVRLQEVSRIAAVTACLLRTGIDFVQAIRIARTATRNTVLSAALTQGATSVVSGRSITAALEATGAFPPVVVEVFALGEQSGRLDELLERLADDLDAQVQSLAQRLSALLEPAVIILLAAVIALVAFATMLPIMEASDAL